MGNKKSALYTLALLIIIALVIGYTSIEALHQKQEQMLAELKQEEELEKQKEIAIKTEVDFIVATEVEKVSTDARLAEAKRKHEQTLAEIAEKKRLEEEAKLARIKAEEERIAKIEAEKQRQIAIEKEKQQVVAQQQVEKKEKKTYVASNVSRSSGQSSPTTELYFDVSFYSAHAQSTGKSKGDKGYGVTASGAIVQEGVTVACPPSMALGTKIYVEGFGNLICQDRGGAIKGHNRIDIYLESQDRAMQLGRKKLKGKIY